MKTPSNKWLSIIIPTFNGEKYLASALESIAEQELSNTELLLVDDGSTDSTRQIIERFAPRLPSLKSYYREHTGSWVAQTNFAISKAQGTYLTFLHQDDTWEPTRLKSLKALTEKYPEAVLFFHPAYFIDPQGRRVGTWHPPLPNRTEQIPGEVILSRLIVQNFIAVPSPLIRRDVLNRIGPFDEKLWYTADWKCWLNFALSGDWVYHPVPLCSFRLHPQSQTVAGSSLRTIDEFRLQHDLVQDEFLPKIPQQEKIEKIARMATRINCALAAKFHNKSVNYCELFSRLFLLGPFGWYRLFYYSRLCERVFARLRIILIVTA